VPTARVDVGRPKADRPTKSIVTLRGTEEWGEWANELARLAECDLSDLITDLMKREGKKRGHRTMPRRTATPVPKRREEGGRS
jgi:hypothetical protein